MKKSLIALLLAAMLVLTFASCTNNNNDSEETKAENNTSETKTEETKAEADNGANATADILNKVFEKYGEDDMFPIMGGDMENVVDGKAGIYSASDKEGLMSVAHITEELLNDTTEVATALHMMNANTFTGAAFALNDGVDAKAFASSLKDSILGTQWMCGWPEQLVIFSVDGNVGYVLGAADLIDNFMNNAKTVYGDALVVEADTIVE